MPLLVAVSLLLSVLLPAACAKSDGGFGIYLADSGEMVLSLKQIKAYHSLDYSLELTPQGIEKWNSFQISTTVPKLSQSLYQRDFILKIDGKEVCRGQFYSLVSSASYNGVVIMDSVMKLEGDRNAIKIDFGYAWSFPPSEESRITAELERFFGDKHLLVVDEEWRFPS
ncbi:MAG: hypothetical protein ABSD79_03065 [Dehalococcoidales bacterium]